MNTSEVLNRAGDRIQEFGHHKGGATGDGGIHVAPMCMVGAITYVRLFVDGATVDDGRRAQAALVAYLGSAIVDWNDAPERTADDVVEVLRAAAVIEAAKENSDTREPVTA